MRNRFPLPLLKALWLSLLLTLLAAATASAQLVFGPGSSQEGDRLDTIVAIVDNDVITRSELDRALTRASSQIRRSGAEPPPAEVLERQVLEQLVQQLLQRRAALSNNISVDEATINAAVSEVASRNNLTLEELQRTLETREGISFEEYRRELGREILAARLRQRLIDSRINVSEGEVDNWLGIDSGDANLAYRIAQILIEVPIDASAEQRSQALAEAQRLLAQLRGGADFQSLAVAASDGRQALKGGELGWRRTSELPTIFVDVVPKLAVGEVSEPISSPSGFHLVTVLESRRVGAAGAEASAQDPRQAARETLFRRKVEEAWEQLLRQLRSEAYVEVRL